MKLLLEEVGVKSPVPELARDSLKLSEAAGVSFGQGAMVVQVNHDGKNYAFKWFAKFHGESADQLLARARSIKNEEEYYFDAGLTEEQVPKNNFFIGEGVLGDPELFSLQTWCDGTMLKNVRLRNIIGNRELRLSLANLFNRCSSIYEDHGVFPDLISGDKVTVLGKKIPDPRKIVWPFWTSNIMICDDVAVLCDTESQDPRQGSFTEKLILLHRELTIFTAKLLTLDVDRPKEKVSLKDNTHSL
ncbi:hypothetical protein KBC75_00740 [Candidatus Shapirobacteria bacterium]|nr:hypothetical protein [Candidatus Shapirobacteria bacterium]